MPRSLDIPLRKMPKARCSMPNAQRKAHWALGVALWALSLASLAAQQASTPPQGFSTTYMDRSVDACTDFYQFACGNWLATNPVPADRSRYGRINELADRNVRIVRDILESAAQKTAGRTSDEQKIGDAYAACTDEGAVEAKRAQPIMPLLRDVDRVG